MESNTTSKQAVPHQQLPRASILTGPSKQLQSLSGTPSMLRSYHVTGVGSDVKVIQMHARLGEPKEGHNNIVPPPKTRNFTQVPSLKSSPLQKRPQAQEEDYFEEECVLHTDDHLGEENTYSPPYSHGIPDISTKRSPRLPLSTHELVNAFSGRRQGAFRPNGPFTDHITAYNEVRDMPYQYHSPALHSRGQSMFEVQRSLAHGSHGLLNHQRLQKRALDQGSLGLEEHLPSNNQDGAKVLEEVEDDDEEEKEYYQVDQEHIMTDYQDDDGAAIRTLHFEKQQDTPDLLHRPEPHTSSQEANIPKSSHSSSQDPSPQVLYTPNTQSMRSVHINHQEQNQDKRSLRKAQDEFSQKSSEQSSFTPNALSVFHRAQQHQQLNFKLTPVVVATTALNQATVTTINGSLKSSGQSSFISCISKSPQHACSVPPERVITPLVPSRPTQSQYKECNESVEDDIEADLPSEAPAMSITGRNEVHSIVQSLYEEGRPPIGKRTSKEGMSLLQAASTKIGDPFTKHGGSRSSSEMPKVPAPNDQWSEKNHEVDSKFLLGSFSSQNFQSSERMQKKLQEHIDEFTQGKVRQSSKAQEDQETELLKQEYLKLKQTLDQLQSSTQVSGGLQQKGRQQPRTTTHKKHQSSIERSAKPGGTPSEILKRGQPDAKNPHILIEQNQEKPKPKNVVKAGQIGQDFLKGALIVETRREDQVREGKKAARLQSPPNVATRDKESEKRHVFPRANKREDTQKHAKSTKITKRRVYADISRSNSSRQSSSFEDFQRAAGKSYQLGLSPDSEEKHLFVSNLKSSASRTNTTKQSIQQQQRRNQKPPHSVEGSQEEDERYLSGSAGDLLSQSSSNEDRLHKSSKRYSSDEGNDEHESSGKKKRKRDKLQRKRRTAQSNTQKGGRKDRKQLKININMNSVTGAPQAHQPYLKHQEPHLQSSEELLQRQILQQQQFLLAAMAQQQQFALHPPQPMLIQQQIALQHQQLMLPQQPLGAYPGLIQPSYNLNPIINQDQQQFVHGNLTTRHGHLIKDVSAGNLNLDLPKARREDHQIQKSTLRPNNSIPEVQKSINQPSRDVQHNFKEPMSMLSHLIEDNRFQQNFRLDFPQNAARQLLGNDYLNSNRTQTLHSRNRTLSQNYSSPLKQMAASVDDNAENIVLTQQNYQYMPTQENQVNHLNQKDDDDYRTNMPESIRNMKNEQGFQAKFDRQKRNQRLGLKNEGPLTGQFGVHGTHDGGRTNVEGKMPFSRHGDLKKGYGGSSSSSPEVVMEEGVRNVDHKQKRIPHVTKRGSSIGDIRSLKQPAKLEPPQKSQPPIQLQVEKSVPAKAEIHRVTKEEFDNAEGQEGKKDQDKKGPQALWIGFEDEKKDPFKDKPALKPRQAAEAESRQKELSAIRSKSAKGTTSIINKQDPQKNRVSLKQSQASLKGTEDRQLKSPAHQPKQVPPAIIIASQPLKASIIDISPMKSAAALVHGQGLKISQVSDVAKQGAKPILKSRPATSKHSTSSVSRAPPILKDTTPQQKAVPPKVVEVRPVDKTKAVQIDLTPALDEAEIVNDELDPNHNKDLPVAVFDKKPSAAAMEQVSLAEMFKVRRRDVVEKLQSRKQAVVDQDGGQAEEQDCLQAVPKTEKKELTKEELFKIRKEMMKSKNKKREEVKPVQAVEPPSKPDSQKDELMLRLALGKKTQVDQKEMKRLTKQNYQNLPEMKRKRDEELKRQEHQARKAATQEYLKQLDETRKKKAAVINKRRLAHETQSQGI